jgi:hypothetical protein
MTFGFPASHTETYQAAAVDPSDLHAAVKMALNVLGWNISAERPDQPGRGPHISCRTSLNMRSYGEKISITLSDDCSVSITSKCVYPVQCIDWGQNTANVDRFWLALFRELLNQSKDSKKVAGK